MTLISRPRPEPTERPRQPPVLSARARRKNSLLILFGTVVFAAAMSATGFMLIGLI